MLFQESMQVVKKIPYPKDLMDIVTGYLVAGLNEEQIFGLLSNDLEIKQTLEIDEDQIRSAIEDSFFIFKRKLI